LATFFRFLLQRVGKGCKEWISCENRRISSMKQQRTTLGKALAFLILNAILVPIVWLLVDAIIGGAM